MRTDSQSGQGDVETDKLMRNQRVVKGLTTSDMKTGVNILHADGVDCWQVCRQREMNECRELEATPTRQTQVGRRRDSDSTF